MNNVAIVPAAAGFYYLQAEPCDGELVFDAYPVIAWRIVVDLEGDADKYPITTGDDFSARMAGNTQARGVLAPDGQVYMWGDVGVYPDRTSWEAEITRCYAARRAAKQKIVAS
jgi:hypothetical protein